jgi:hypothetical protein
VAGGGTSAAQVWHRCFFAADRRRLSDISTITSQPHNAQADDPDAARLCGSILAPGDARGLHLLVSGAFRQKVGDFATRWPQNTLYPLIQATVVV